MAGGLINGMSVIEWANGLIPKARVLFGLGEEIEIKFFYQSENTTYMVKHTRTGKKAVLRICEFGYHNKEELEGEILFMNSISSGSDLILPVPVKGADGEYVQTLGSVDGQECYSVMFSFVEGKSPENLTALEQEDYFEKLGEITAKMHRATIKSGISEQVKRPVWSTEALFGENATLGSYRSCEGFGTTECELFDKAEALIKKRLKKYGKNKENYGLVHSDLRLANLLVQGDQIAVIDFDDCGMCWYLNDYGSAFSFMEDADNREELSRRWVIGYEKIRPLSKEDKDELDTFIVIRRLLLQGFLATHTESEAIKDGIHIDYLQGTIRLIKEYLNDKQ